MPKLNSKLPVLGNMDTMREGMVNGRNDQNVIASFDSIDIQRGYIVLIEYATPKMVNEFKGFDGQICDNMQGWTLLKDLNPVFEGLYSYTCDYLTGIERIQLCIDTFFYE